MNDHNRNQDDPRGSLAQATSEIESALQSALVEERRILDEVAAMPLQPANESEWEYLRAAVEWIEDEEEASDSTRSAAVIAAAVEGTAQLESPLNDRSQSTVPRNGHRAPAVSDRGRSAFVTSDSRWKPGATTPGHRFAGLPISPIAVAATIALCVGAAALLSIRNQLDPAPHELRPRYLGGDDSNGNVASGVTAMPNVVDWSEIESTRPGPYRVRIRTSPPHHDDPGEVVYEMGDRQFPSLWACPRNLRSALPETFLFQVLADDLHGEEEIVYQRLFSPPFAQD